MSRLATYEKFFNSEQAELVLAILKEHAIPFEFSPISQTVDVVITGGQPSYLYEIKISSTQFETVNRLLREEMEINIYEVDPDYYLFAFEDHELEEIIERPDEWGRQDFVIARKILESRGVVYTAEELDEIWNKRMETLAQPASDGSGWIYVGYALSVLSAFVGIIVGLVFWQSTKTLPNGSRYYIYDEATRKRGKNIFYLSLIVTAVILTLILARSFTIVSNNWYNW